MKTVLFRVLLVAAVGLQTATSARAGTDQPTRFTNVGSVINTRHNLTQRSVTGSILMSGEAGIGGMELTRNQYGQVCVYCHTPHGANNTTIAAPLWNRAIPTTTYATYNQLGTTVEQTYSQPGSASLSCLSCHDGQQAVDAIMNMPGSGGYSTSPNNITFLNTWVQPYGYGNPSHLGLKDGECLICHSTNPVGMAFPLATDFAVFVIGTDLRNDHPVGVTYPTTNGPGTDWNKPTGTLVVGGRTHRFFDDSGDGRMQKSEIRLYDSGAGAEVECATCHDPHGVPSGAPGSSFFPSFLRKSIDGSNLCLTCHAK